MAKAGPGNIAPEVIEGLNGELGGVRALYAEQNVALDGLFGAVGGVKEDFVSALTNGEVPKREPSWEDALEELAGTLPSVIELAARYGDVSQQFVDRLQRLITTRKDGTSIVGSINPFFVRHDFEPERNYIGDKKGLPKLYVVSDSLSGRVVDTQYRSKRSEFHRRREVTDIGVWVWPDDIEEWTNGSNSGARHLSLLDKSAEFVRFVKGSALPKPEAYNPKYDIGID
jgi:hypothetical protein